MNEFEIIEAYMKPLSRGRAEAQGYANDAAVLAVPDGYELVVSSDSAVAGVHFLEDQSPLAIAQKALRRNISDLNAMGAVPYCYQLCLCLPGVDEVFLRDFTRGLAEDQERYGLFLSGGDITSTPGPLSLSMTVMGLVPCGKALTRSGARDGDFVVLSGAVGDAALGLKALREGKDAPELIKAYHVPEIPAVLAEGLADYAGAVIDVSDGLVQDLGHICTASGLGAVIDIEAMCFSPCVQAWLDEGMAGYEDVLSGGDDYQLLMAVGPERYEAFCMYARQAGVYLQKIGVFQKGEHGVRVQRDGEDMKVEKAGWRHF